MVVHGNLIQQDLIGPPRTPTLCVLLTFIIYSLTLPHSVLGQSSLSETPPPCRSDVVASSKQPDVGGRIPPLPFGEIEPPWLDTVTIAEEPVLLLMSGEMPGEWFNGSPLFAPTIPVDAGMNEPFDASGPTVPSPSRSSGGGMMGMGGGGGRSPLGYRAVWEPAQPVGGQATDFGLLQHDVNVTAPLWKSDPHLVMLSGGVRADFIQTDAVFPESGREFPSELWNIRIGTNYMRKFDNGWTGMATFNIGSASDVPFGEMRDVNFGAMAFLRVPSGDGNAWIFSLVYSPMSQIPFPVPMVGYFWQATDEFSLNIGLPLQMVYRPTERWTFDVSYMLLTTIHAQASYQLNEQWNFYGGFDWQNQSWFLQDRTSSRERLFSYEKRLTLGVKTTVMKHLILDFSTGYLFDRFYFNGEDYDDRNHDRIDIGNGLFISAQAGLGW